MRLFCDQNITLETIAYLRDLDHDVLSTRDVGLSRVDDDAVLNYAIREKRILLTFNADFSDIRAFPVGVHSGIIRLRIKRQDSESLHPLLACALRSLHGKDLAGRLVTVKTSSIRIRGQA